MVVLYRSILTKITLVHRPVVDCCTTNPCSGVWVINSLSQPAQRERGKRQFAVSAYYDYYTHVLTRQQYLRKVCYRYGPRIDL